MEGIEAEAMQESADDPAEGEPAVTPNEPVVEAVQSFDAAVADVQAEPLNDSEATESAPVAATGEGEAMEVEEPTDASAGFADNEEPAAAAVEHRLPSKPMMPMMRP